MDQNELWDFFKTTGNLNAYLKYKEMQQLEAISPKKSTLENPSPTCEGNTCVL